MRGQRAKRARAAGRVASAALSCSESDDHPPESRPPVRSSCRGCNGPRRIGLLEGTPERLSVLDAFDADALARRLLLVTTRIPGDGVEAGALHDVACQAGRRVHPRATAGGAGGTLEPGLCRGRQLLAIPATLVRKQHDERGELHQRGAAEGGGALPHEGRQRQRCEEAALWPARHAGQHARGQVPGRQPRRRRAPERVPLPDRDGRHVPELLEHGQQPVRRSRYESQRRCRPARA